MERKGKERKGKKERKKERKKKRKKERKKTRLIFLIIVRVDNYPLKREGLLELIPQKVVSEGTVPTRDFIFRNSLHLACALGGIRYVRSILDKEPSKINSLSEEGATPLLCACSSEQPSIVSYLLEFEKVDLQATLRGKVALEIATEINNEQLIGMLSNRRKKYLKQFIEASSLQFAGYHFHTSDVGLISDLLGGSSIETAEFDISLFPLSQFSFGKNKQTNKQIIFQIRFHNMSISPDFLDVLNQKSMEALTIKFFLFFYFSSSLSLS